MYDKIGVIGDKDVVLAFKAIGVDVFGTKNPLEARDIIKSCAKNGYAVLYLTEELAKELEDFLQRYKTVPYPAIIPIPSKSGSTGYTMKGLKKDMEKAIGADILFREN